MTFEGIDEEADIEKLRAKARSLSMENWSLANENTLLLASIQRLTQELADATDRDRQQTLKFEIRRLNEQLAAKNRELYGKSRSERREKPKEPKAEPKEQKGHGPTPQPKVDTAEEHHRLDEPDRVCPHCEGGLPLVEMPGQTEDSVQITVVERRVVQVLHKRQKSRCSGCGHIDTALGPKPVIPGGRYSPEFAVTVAVDKYADHLPLERQATRYGREGLEISSQTLWDLLVALYHYLLPSYLELQKHILSQEVVGVDESTWRVMGAGASARWWVWALTGKDAVFFQLAPTRGGSAARALLQNYGGIVMADGYGVYKSLEQQGQNGVQVPLPKDAPKGVPTVDSTPTLPWVPRYMLVTCWMHARRGFIQAEKNHPAAGKVLDLIGGLYAVEERVKAEAGGDPQKALELRRHYRNTESRAIIREIRTWMDAQKPTPKLKLSAALEYLRNQWSWLIRFLEDPRIPLDNGESERRMRGLVLGRKNYSGSRSELGTRVAALMYSLVESCKMQGLNPGAYLREAVRRAMELPGTILLPHWYAAECAAEKAALDAKTITATG